MTSFGVSVAPSLLMVVVNTFDVGGDFKQMEDLTEYYD